MIVYDKFIEQNKAPKGAKKISLYDSNNVKICDSDIPVSKQNNLGEPLYKVGLLSDVHIQASSTEGTYSQADFARALSLFREKGMLMTCISGDLTVTGTDAEFAKYVEIRDANRGTMPVFETTGNHEATSGRTYGYKTNLTNCIAYNIYNKVGTHFCYTLEKNKYTGWDLSLAEDDGVMAQATVEKTIDLDIPDNDIYIFVGILGDANCLIFFEDEMKWLYSVLEANRNKRCFIFEHCRAENLRYDSTAKAYVEDMYKDKVSGNATGKYLKNLWNSVDRNTNAKYFETMMAHYTNCLWFHGHTHMIPKTQEAQEAPGRTVSNIDTFFGDGYSTVLANIKPNTKFSWGIHLPSCAAPRIPTENGISYEELDAGSNGCFMEVYDDCVVLKGYDFIAEKYTPVGEFILPTTRKTIEAGTYLYKDELGS